MKFINKLERKLGRYAIPNLITYIIALYVIGFLSYQVGGGKVYYSYFSWNVDAILSGQVWRLFTFLLNPPSTNILSLLIICYVYWGMGQMLERIIGTFGFNLYIFSGILFHIIGGFVAYFVTGTNINMGTTFLNLSMLLAIIFLMPDLQFNLYFLIPIKAKWLGIFQVVLYGYLIITGGTATKIEIIFSLLNAVLFFFISRNLTSSSLKNRKRRRTYQRKVRKVVQMTPYRHKCAVCGRTELDDSNLEFRYCSKCVGGYEYCMEHLYTHVHVTVEDNQIH